MIHKKMLVFMGVLSCLSAGTFSAEPPISPWQALNPALTDANQFDIPHIQEEYVDTPYEVSYPEVSYQNGTDYLLDEELLVEKLPFKMPFKMDKKQMAVVMKLLKAAVKPILKSRRLREAVAYIDESFATYRTDLETQMYVTLVLDSLQEIYEGKETSELNMMVKRVFTDMSDEETARTLGTVWTSYVSPLFTNYVYDPVRKYVVSPVRSYFYNPISNYVSDFADRIGTWMGNRRTPYIDIQYPETYTRWSEAVSSYASRISDWTGQAREGLEMARRMLELQDEARSCNDCGGELEDDISNASLQVYDLTWLTYLIGGLILAAIIAAIVIPAAVAIPLAFIGTGGGPTGPTGPTGFTAFTGPVFPVAPAPIAFAPVASPIRRDYSPYSHIKHKTDAFDQSILEESNFNLKFGDEDAYKQYSSYSGI